jgi:hypothetical protein
MAILFLAVGSEQNLVTDLTITSLSEDDVTPKMFQTHLLFSV